MFIGRCQVHKVLTVDLLPNVIIVDVEPRHDEELVQILTDPLVGEGGYIYEVASSFISSCRFSNFNSPQKGTRSFSPA